MPAAVLHRRPRGLRRHLRYALVGVVVSAVLVMVLVVGLLPRADAAFTSKAVNGTNSLGAANYFTCAAAVTNAAPAVWYKLDETSGTVAGNDGQGIDGSYQGTTTKAQARACVRDSGYAVAFNGTSGYVSLDTRYTVPTTYTFEAWVKTTTTTGGLIGGIGASATGTSATVDRVLYLTTNGRLAFGINASSKSAVISTASFNDGKWHHAVATLGTAGSALYVDGARVATSSTTATGTYTGYVRVAYDNLSGWPSAPSTSYFKGTLDDVALYTRTFTAAEVSDHFEAGS